MRNKAYRVQTLVAVTILASGMTAWAKTYISQTTSVVPTAAGTIHVKTANQGENMEVTPNVDDLVKPTLLAPPANYYVVWIKPQEGPVENEGILCVNDFENGELQMTTAAAKFTFLVTAEADAYPEAPSNRIILRTEVGE